MIEHQEQRDRWDQVKGKIIGIWSNITDEELERTRGNISAISNLIIQRNGDTKQEVASRLVDVMHAVNNKDDNKIK